MDHAGRVWLALGRDTHFCSAGDEVCCRKTHVGIVFFGEVTALHWKIRVFGPIFHDFKGFILL